GGGEKLTLKAVAKHADIWNGFGPPELFRHKVQVLGEHCASVGRNLADIEISWAGMGLICDSPAMKDEALRKTAAIWKRPVEEMDRSALIGTVDEIRSKIDAFVEAGVTHFITSAAPPFDHAGVQRFADQVASRYR